MTKPLPLHLLDISCFVWRLYEDYCKVRNHIDPTIARQWLRASWVSLLNHPNSCLEFTPHSTLLILDTKKGGQYWRHKLNSYYKGGRGEKTEEYFEIKRALYTLLKDPRYNHLKMWACPGFEADDLIAEAVRCAPKSRQLYIHTIDGDLLQLVRPNVTFAWTFMGKERIKDQEGALSYISNKYEICLRGLDWFGKIKSVIGDSSDGLPEGGDIRIFDLTKPDRVYRLSKHMKNYSEFKKACKSSQDDSFPGLAAKAEAWINQMGLPEVYK